MNNAFADIDPILFDYAQKYLGRFMPITREELSSFYNIAK
jgi:hypothetical protein